jgi:hypothetical protein
VCCGLPFPKGFVALVVDAALQRRSIFVSLALEFRAQHNAAKYSNEQTFQIGQVPKLLFFGRNTVTKCSNF